VDYMLGLAGDRFGSTGRDRFRFGVVGGELTFSLDLVHPDPAFVDGVDPSARHGLPPCCGVDDVCREAINTRDKNKLSKTRRYADGRVGSALAAARLPMFQGEAPSAWPLGEDDRGVGRKAAVQPDDADDETALESQSERR
jgi:hypothetical protein